MGVLSIMLIHFTGPSAPRSSVRGRLQTYALVAAALAAGALLIAFGLIMLAGLAVTGAVVGGGIAIYHRLTGRWPKFLHVRTYVGPIGSAGPAERSMHGLDPSKEVFPSRRETRRISGDSGPDPDA